jgi:predicted HTH transcriptional regulator
MGQTGTGISRMRAITKAASVPEPKFTSNLFFTTIFNRPMHPPKDSEVVSEIMLEKILDLIRKNKNISSKKIAEALGLVPRSVERKIAKLKQEGYSKRIGSPKSGYWEITK